MLNILRLIQGDVFELNITILDYDKVPEIEEMYFSCLEENIIKKFEKVTENEFYMVIPSAETKSFVPNITNFDVTVKFFDGEDLTFLFEGKIEILKKRNKIGRN